MLPGLDAKPNQKELIALINRPKVRAAIFTGVQMTGVNSVTNGSLVVGSASSFGQIGATPAVFNAAETGAQSNAVFGKFRASNSGAEVQLIKSRNGVVGSNTIVQANDVLGVMRFGGADGTSYIEGANLGAEVDGTPGLNDMPTRLVVRTTADGASTPTERSRWDSQGNFLHATTNINPAVNGVTGLAIRSNGLVSGCVDAGAAALLGRTSSNGDVEQFYRSAVQVGSISVTTTNTAYNTSSDYRLKYEIEGLTDSGAFIDALLPRKGKWRADGSDFVGFLAHELQEVSPSSVTGEKDAMQEFGTAYSPAKYVDGVELIGVGKTIENIAEYETPDGWTWRKTGERPKLQQVEYGSAEVIANMVAELQCVRRREEKKDAVIANLLERVSALEAA